MLTAVDAVEITILVDNLSDSLLPSTPIALRPRMSMEAGTAHLRAEHGYGVLVTVESGGRQSSLLYDAGPGADEAFKSAPPRGALSRPGQITLGELPLLEDGASLQVAVANSTRTPRDSSKVIGRLKPPDRVSGSEGLSLTGGSLQIAPSQLQTLVAQEDLSQTEASSFTTMAFFRIGS